MQKADKTMNKKCMQIFTHDKDIIYHLLTRDTICQLGLKFHTMPHCMKINFTYYAFNVYAMFC